MSWFGWELKEIKVGEIGTIVDSVSLQLSYQLDTHPILLYFCCCLFILNLDKVLTRYSPVNELTSYLSYDGFEFILEVIFCEEEDADILSSQEDNIR